MQKQLQGLKRLSVSTIKENKIFEQQQRVLCEIRSQNQAHLDTKESAQFKVLEHATMALKRAEFEVKKVCNYDMFHGVLLDGLVLQKEIYPGVPGCFKIELKKFASPVTIHVKYLSGRMGTTNDGAYENLDALAALLYGSFKHKEPSIDQSDLQIEHPKTFQITFTEDRNEYYYLSLGAEHPLMIEITAVSSYQKPKKHVNPDRQLTALELKLQKTLNEN